MKKTKAAPAPNTPFRRVWHDGGSSTNRVRYRVWYAFSTEPASKHDSAMRKVTLVQILEHTTIVNSYRAAMCKFTMYRDYFAKQLICSFHPSLHKMAISSHGRTCKCLGVITVVKNCGYNYNNLRTCRKRYIRHFFSTLQTVIILLINKIFL